MKTILERIKSETPGFFKVVRKWSLSLAGAATAAMACSYYVEMPIWLMSTMHDCIIAGVIGTFLSSLAKQDESANPFKDLPNK